MSQTAGHNSTEKPRPRLTAAVETADGGGVDAILVNSPNGTRLELTVDEVSGGVRVTSRPGSGPILAAVPLGLGKLVLDGRTE